ncbi:MAG: EAL domain-containing protein [Acidimicrobiia bacterium]|nr:EAL domain-containing protein [Acidimicrobiia bacterium]
MEACRQATRWDAEGVGSGLSMSVNLSARQFLLPDLPDIVSAAVRESGLPPERLCLEMTETALMDEGDATLASLEALRALGVQLSVDDFGTGYSSLAYLKRFPVDWLKVDQSFVDGLGTDAEDTAIVTAVISLAHALDLHVVAEGVETADQLANLRTLGCDIGQGTLFSAPMPASELRAFLRGRRVAPRPLPNLSSNPAL